jgi:hypothetical protein
MKFDVYGRFRLEVQRERTLGSSIGFPSANALANDLIIPSTLEANEIATFLDDIFHELSGPGQSVKLMQ